MFTNFVHRYYIIYWTIFTLTKMFSNHQAQLNSCPLFKLSHSSKVVKLIWLVFCFRLQDMATDLHYIVLEILPQTLHIGLLDKD